MATKRQCHGETKSGKRCQRGTANWFCYQHRDQERQFITSTSGPGPSTVLSGVSPVVPNYTARMQGVLPDYGALYKNIFPDYPAMVRRMGPTVSVLDAVNRVAVPKKDYFPDLTRVFKTINDSLNINAQMRQAFMGINKMFNEPMLKSVLAVGAPLNVTASLAPTLDALKWLQEPGRVERALDETTVEEFETATEEVAKIIEKQGSLAKKLATDAKVTTHALMCFCLALLVMVASPNPGVQNLASVYLSQLLAALQERIKQIKEDHEGD